MGELRYSINVTVDGCCDHRVGVISEEFHRHHANNLKRADGLIFGRVTYQMMEDAWRRPEGDTTPEADLDPFVAAIDPARKFVVSSTLDSVDWNSELIRGDLETAVRKLKEQSVRGLATGGVTLAARARRTRPHRRIRVRRPPLHRRPWSVPLRRTE